MIGNSVFFLQFNPSSAFWVESAVPNVVFSMISSAKVGRPQSGRRRPQAIAHRIPQMPASPGDVSTRKLDPKKLETNPDQRNSTAPFRPHKRARKTKQNKPNKTQVKIEENSGEKWVNPTTAVASTKVGGRRRIGRPNLYRP